VGDDRSEEQAILRAAFRVIGSSPSGATSVVDILREAGLSTRAFYRHFASKDDLILAMYRQAQERVTAELSEATATAASPREALAQWVDHLLGVAYDPKRAAQSLVLSSPEARSAKGFRDTQQEGLLGMRAILVEILRAGQRSGEFPHTDPVEDARAIQSVVSGLVEARLMGIPGPTRVAARDHTVALFLRALGAPASGAESRRAVTPAHRLTGSR
jgi:AcrR family transcriptional regulator